MTDRRARLARQSLLLTGALLALTVLGPFLTPFSPLEGSLDERLRPPDSTHWLGTDDLGRDVLSRLISGGQISLSAASAATSLALFLGLAIGSLAGLSRGLLRRVAGLLIEIVQTVPGLVLAVSAATFFSPSVISSAIIIGLTAWIDLARATSALVRGVLASPFVAIARAEGASEPWILLRHVSRNVAWPTIAFVPYILGGAIVTEASLSFLGLGTPPPAASWGRALADARSLLPGAWWCALPPAMAILIVVAAVRRLGANLLVLWAAGTPQAPGRA